MDVNGNCIFAPGKEHIMGLIMKFRGQEIPIEWENQTAINTIIQKNSSVIKMRMEKKGGGSAGNLGISIPRNDRNMITRPGDIIYKDGQLVVCLGEESVSATKLGHIKYPETQVKNMFAPASLQVEFWEK